MALARMTKIHANPGFGASVSELGGMPSIPFSLRRYPYEDEAASEQVHFSVETVGELHVFYASSIEDVVSWKDSTFGDDSWWMAVQQGV